MFIPITFGIDKYNAFRLLFNFENFAAGLATNAFLVDTLDQALVFNGEFWPLACLRRDGRVGPIAERQGRFLSLNGTRCCQEQGRGKQSDPDGH